MKLTFFLVALSLSACATVTTPRQLGPTSMNVPPTTPFMLTITGDELKQTGRTDMSEALRASSPIFH
jgi:hypothetical protein